MKRSCSQNEEFFLEMYLSIIHRAQLFRTLLLMFLTVAIVLTVADVFDRCYWPYRQMRPSIPLGTTASLGPAVQTLSRNFVVFPTDL